MTICEGFSVGQSVGRQERRWGQTEGGEVWSLSDQVRDFGLYPEDTGKPVEGFIHARHRKLAVHQEQSFLPLRILRYRHGRWKW